MLSQRRGQSWVTAVGLVAGDPSAGETAGHCGLDQPARQLRLRGEPDVLGHPGLRPALRVVGPRLGQVERDIDQSVPDGGGVGQVDCELTVLDLPGGPGVLPLHADGVAAL